jgi:hypothetical protein
LLGNGTRKVPGSSKELKKVSARLANDNWIGQRQGFNNGLSNGNICNPTVGHGIAVKGQLEPRRSSEGNKSLPGPNLTRQQETSIGEAALGV